MIASRTYFQQVCDGARGLVRVPVCYWTFAGHDEGFCHNRAIATSRGYGSFVGHDELSWVFRAVVSGELRWLVAQWLWCVLQDCREWRVRVICVSRRWDVVVLEGMDGSDAVDLILMGGPADVVVHDWSECSRILAALCQFLLAWLLLCAWPQPVGLLDSARFAR